MNLTYCWPLCCVARVVTVVRQCVCRDADFIQIEERRPKRPVVVAAMATPCSLETPHCLQLCTRLSLLCPSPPNQCDRCVSTGFYAKSLELVAYHVCDIVWFQTMRRFSLWHSVVLFTVDNDFVHTTTTPPPTTVCPLVLTRLTDKLGALADVLTHNWALGVSAIREQAGLVPSLINRHGAGLDSVLDIIRVRNRRTLRALHQASRKDFRTTIGSDYVSPPLLGYCTDLK